MTCVNYDNSYLQIVENPLVYAESMLDSASVIVKECAQVLYVTRASFWLLDDDRTEATCVTLYNAATDGFETGAILSQKLFPKYFDALESGRVLDAVDTFTDPRTSELTESYLKVLDVRSLLDATIRDVHNGQLRGILCCEMVGARRDWSQDERIFAASISDLLSQRMVAVEWNTSATTYQALYESSNDGIVVFSDRVFSEVNPAACATFGGSVDELVGMSPIELSPEFQPCGELSETKARRYIDMAVGGNPQTFEWVHRRLDGTSFDAEVSLKEIELAGEKTLFALVRDITDRKEAQHQAEIARRQAEHQATRDPLTGLFNRRQLHVHVGQLIDGLENPNQKVALVILDLNRFKEINDSLGHETGDKVLVGLSKNLKRRVARAGGSLFRLGGDEFVAVFDSETCNEPLDNVVHFINQELKTPIEVECVHFEMSASVGAALYPDDGQDSHELLRCADVAMYHAKGRDGASCWYEAANDRNDKRRLSMVAELRQAIRNDELVLYYQPRIKIGTGQVTGCEALVRWQHPKQGLLPPADFLPVAEMTELIHPLTSWVVDSAFAQILHLRSIGHSVPVAINLSARNLPDSQLFDLIEERLQKHDICPSLLEIEITESALINNPQRSIQNLLRLEALGVSIAIDDFGTGYSSLSLLRDLPMDTLKIDRRFVDEMLNSPCDEVIVNSTISLAHNFSAKVVAEGVENRETLEALKASNCDEAQGYFIARPMPADSFHSWLTDSANELCSV